MTNPYNSTIVHRAVRKGGRYMGPERFDECELAVAGSHFLFLLLEGVAGC